MFTAYSEYPLGHGWRLESASPSESSSGPWNSFGGSNWWIWGAASHTLVELGQYRKHAMHRLFVGWAQSGFRSFAGQLQVQRPQDCFLHMAMFLCFCAFGWYEAGLELLQSFRSQRRRVDGGFSSRMAACANPKHKWICKRSLALVLWDSGEHPQESVFANWGKSPTVLDKEQGNNPSAFGQR